jgi:hypothetical protein
VYRRGNLTAKQFTPREDDTRAEPGAAPGISTDRTLEDGVKGQRIDLGQLPAGFGAFEDDPAEGGTEGHITIAPVDENGAIHQQRLEEWARSRDSGDEHELTRLLLEAVVEKNVRGPR